MVRFSDMLGGGGDKEGTRATAVPEAQPFRTEPEPEAAIEPEPEAETEPEAGMEPEPAAASVDAAAPETPEEVLDRLTHYASTARAPDPGQQEQDLTPVGDDLLPRPKSEARKHRRK